MAPAVASVDNVLPQLGQSKQLTHLLKKKTMFKYCNFHSIEFAKKKKKGIQDLEPTCSNMNFKFFDSKAGGLNK